MQLYVFQVHRLLLLRIKFMFLSTIAFRLVNLALAGSIGMTLVILACALPQYKYVVFLVAVIFLQCFEI